MPPTARGPKDDVPSLADCLSEEDLEQLGDVACKDADGKTVHVKPQLYMHCARFMCQSKAAEKAKRLIKEYKDPQDQSLWSTAASREALKGKPSQVPTGFQRARKEAALKCEAGGKSPLAEVLAAFFTKCPFVLANRLANDPYLCPEAPCPARGAPAHSGAPPSVAGGNENDSLDSDDEDGDVPMNRVAPHEEDPEGDGAADDARGAATPARGRVTNSAGTVRRSPRLSPPPPAQRQRRDGEIAAGRFTAASTMTVNEKLKHQQEKMDEAYELVKPQLSVEQGGRADVKVMFVDLFRTTQIEDGDFIAYGITWDSVHAFVRAVSQLAPLAPQTNVAGKWSDPASTLRLLAILEMRSGRTKEQWREIIQTDEPVHASELPRDFSENDLEDIADAWRLIIQGTVSEGERQLMDAGSLHEQQKWKKIIDLFEDAQFKPALPDIVLKCIKTSADDIAKAHMYESHITTYNLTYIHHITEVITRLLSHSSWPRHRRLTSPPAVAPPWLHSRGAAGNTAP
mmetsp:Transcript_18207/g.53042  ORF Transcript_18207/g.53042 Transcript_18207/m.53042 type:complete len:514 (+) Transcript_18207:92-1633(+)